MRDRWRSSYKAAETCGSRAVVVPSASPWKPPGVAAGTIHSWDYCPVPAPVRPPRLRPRSLPPASTRSGNCFDAGIDSRAGLGGRGAELVMSRQLPSAWLYGQFHVLVLDVNGPGMALGPKGARAHVGQSHLPSETAPASGASREASWRSHVPRMRPEMWSSDDRDKHGWR